MSLENLLEMILSALPTDLSKTVTGMILVGGKNSRFGGEKALAAIGGLPIIHRIVSVLRALNLKILIVGDKENLLPDCQEVRFTPDVIRDAGPLGGVLSGLEACNTEYAFCVACDMPFLNQKFITALVKTAFYCANGEVWDVVIPAHAAGLEPLHALYSKRCAPILRTLINSGERRIASLFPLVKTHYFKVQTESWKNSFWNVNTAEDLSCAELFCREHFNVHEISRHKSAQSGIEAQDALGENISA